MADEVVTLTVKGEGGDVFDMDVPTAGTTRREIFDDMVAKGLLVVVEGEIPVDQVPEHDAPELEDDLGTDAGDPPADADVVEVPAKNASTDAWQAYAIAQGADEAEVEGLGRDELIELYAPEA